VTQLFWSSPNENAFAKGHLQYRRFAASASVFRSRIEHTDINVRPIPVWICSA
jgi:hypothetical protein